MKAHIVNRFGDIAIAAEIGFQIFNLEQHVGAVEKSQVVDNCGAYTQPSAD
jgi:hypothetical protein